MNSQASEILSLILNLTGNIEKEFNDRLPRKIGVLAKQHFRENFRKSGFVDGGVRPWQKAQREGGTSTSSRYRTLTSSRNHLMNSIEAIPAKGSVLVYNPVPYSVIHNEGGSMLSFPNVTPKMRRFFWAQYFNAGGKKGERRRRSGSALPSVQRTWCASSSVCPSASSSGSRRS